VKFQRRHVVIVDEIPAQLGVIGVQHPLRGARMNIALAVVTGVEQQRGAALDADVAQAQEQRAVRLAVALDAKQFATGIGALAWPTCPIQNATAIDEGVTASRRLPAAAMIAVEQVHVLKYPAHGEVPEIASDGPANGKKDDVGGMILAAPPQHPADPEDGEENGAEFQSLCLIHDTPPMADIRCHHGRHRRAAP
jgi:hypothetical protein